MPFNGLRLAPVLLRGRDGVVLRAPGRRELRSSGSVSGIELGLPAALELLPARCALQVERARPARLEPLALRVHDGFGSSASFGGAPPRPFDGLLGLVTGRAALFRLTDALGFGRTARMAKRFEGITAPHALLLADPAPSGDFRAVPPLIYHPEKFSHYRAERACHSWTLLTSGVPESMSDQASMASTDATAAAMVVKYGMLARRVVRRIA